MANKNLWVGILVIMLVFWMAVAGCDNGTTNGKPNFNGTWVKGNYSMVITGNDWTFLLDGESTGKGTFIVTGTTSGNVTFNTTHYNQNGSWIPASWTGSGTWSLSGNTFTIGGVPDTTYNGNWIRQ